MAMAKPLISANYAGNQIPSHDAASVQKRNYGVSMSMQSANSQIPANPMFQTRGYLEGPQMNLNQPKDNMMKMEQTNISSQLVEGIVSWTSHETEGTLNRHLLLIMSGVGLLAQIVGQVFDQIFDQGFDQGLGERKNH